jgi:hypothetical protein
MHWPEPSSAAAFAIAAAAAFAIAADDHKSRARCWPVQRRDRLRLELDGAHHRRRG